MYKKCLYSELVIKINYSSNTINLIGMPSNPDSSILFLYFLIHFILFTCTCLFSINIRNLRETKYSILRKPFEIQIKSNFFMSFFLTNFTLLLNCLHKISEKEF